MFEAIRGDRRDDPDVSIRELAARHGVHRRTVRQALASPALGAARVHTVPVRVGHLDPVETVIGEIIQADLDARGDGASNPAADPDGYSWSTDTGGGLLHGP